MRIANVPSVLFLYNEAATLTPNTFIRFINRVPINRRVKFCIILTCLFTDDEAFFVLLFLQAVQHTLGQVLALKLCGRNRKAR